MATFDSVLVPTDGSDHSIRAAEHGAAFARAFDAPLHLITVVDLRVEAGPFSAGGVREEYLEVLRNDAQERIEAVEAAVDLPEGTRTAVIEGEPVADVVAYADDHDVDLLAMGTQGRTGLDRYVTGSVAEGVVRRANVPVVTVRSTERSQNAGAYDDIMVPTDGSAFAATAVDPALAVASAFDARVHVVHVVDLGAVSTGTDGGPPGDVIDYLTAQGERAVERTAAKVRDASIDVVTETRQGFPAKDLLAYCADHDVDLVAMGTAGRTGLSRFLLGSTTERVIRHADVPVMAVPARDRGEA